MLRNDEDVIPAFVTSTLLADVVGFFDDLRSTLVGAAAAVQTWPDIDLFETGGQECHAVARRKDDWP